MSDVIKAYKKSFSLEESVSLSKVKNNPLFRGFKDVFNKQIRNPLL